RVQRFRNNGVSAAGAGETAVLRETAKFDSTIARAGDFVNGVRQRGIVDVSLVSGVEQDDGFVFERVFNPALKLLARGQCAGRIVGRAEVNYIHVLLWRRGDETVAGFARQVNQLGEGPGFVGFAGVAGHDVCVHVNGINRIADGDFVFVAEDVEDVAGIALGA